jgi:hypothetical protein
VSAGQLWQRHDGLVWVEVQAAGVEPSGWRIMVPLVPADQATSAPPLVVAIGRWHARVHLATGVPHDGLGQPLDVLDAGQLDALRDALAALIARP